MSCKYAKPTDNPRIIKCELGFWGGMPHIGVCGVCDNYRGPLRGAGDIVAAIANPIARAIDFVASTNVSGCAGCKKRRDVLNKALPLNKIDNS